METAGDVDLSRRGCVVRINTVVHCRQVNEDTPNSLKCMDNLCCPQSHFQLYTQYIYCIDTFQYFKTFYIVVKTCWNTNIASLSLPTWKKFAEHQNCSDGSSGSEIPEHLQVLSAKPGAFPSLQAVDGTLA